MEKRPDFEGQFDWKDQLLQYELEGGTRLEDGSVKMPNGDIHRPDGTSLLPNKKSVLPSGNGLRIPKGPEGVVMVASIIEGMEEAMSLGVDVRLMTPDDPLARIYHRPDGLRNPDPENGFSSYNIAKSLQDYVDAGGRPIDDGSVLMPDGARHYPDGRSLLPNRYRSRRDAGSNKSFSISNPKEDEPIYEIRSPKDR
jgi:hypothetical protein